MERKKGNIDHIIIGQHGIFVIETKTYRGKIYCKYDDWFQVRQIGEKTRQIKLNYSPSKQAKGNAVGLNSFLKKHYPKLSKEWIWAIVVFPDKQSEINNLEIKAKPEDCDIFESIEKMIEEIKKQKISVELTSEDLSKLQNIFSSEAIDKKIISA